MRRAWRWLNAPSSIGRAPSWRFMILKVYPWCIVLGLLVWWIER